MHLRPIVLLKVACFVQLSGFFYMSITITQRARINGAIIIEHFTTSAFAQLNAYVIAGSFEVFPLRVLSYSSGDIKASLTR